MSIKPVSDIVMDAVAAADPASVAAARARLSTAAGGAPAEPFALDRTRVASPRPQAAVAAAADPPAPDAFKKFEAMVLGQFVETMLPKDAGAAFGGGFAGEMWRGLAAEQIAGQLAERGGIGIARTLLADHYRAGTAIVPVGPMDGPAARAQADRDRLGAALLDETERRFAKAVGAPEAGAADRA